MTISYGDWHGYEEKPTEWRQLCFLEWLHLEIRLHENAGVRSVMLIFAIFNVFHKLYKHNRTWDNQQGILSYQIRQLHCRALGARALNLCSHLPFRMDSFVHGNVSFFPLIDRLVSTIQSNQTVDAFIKYVA